MITNIEELPALIREIYAQTQRNFPSADVERWIETWQGYAQDLPRQIPGIQVENEGATVHLGELSPGCRACQQGAWDCIFVTRNCNLRCPFCISPFAPNPADSFFSAMGKDLEQISRNYALAGIWGVGFSGGEPFLQFDRLSSLVRQLRRDLPEGYLWVYTNGWLVRPWQLLQLGEGGLDEIRFNLAASHYTHTAVLEIVRLAASLFSRVTVEIPVIPEDERYLREALRSWAEAGVRHLNLHELMYEPGTASGQLSGSRTSFVNSDGHTTCFNPESRPVTHRIMQALQQDGLDLAVNDCSVYTKIVQVRKRRIAMARLLLQGAEAREALDENSRYVSIWVIHDQEHFSMVHPHEFAKSPGTYRGKRVLKLSRAAPLSISEPPNWVSVEEL